MHEPRDGLPRQARDKHIEKPLKTVMPFFLGRYICSNELV
eukprot:COSAG06_NODE_72384_length_171_cov_80.777778_1_plen_39_part_01